MSKSGITIRIGIWGPEHAGKTTYVTMLSDLLKREPNVTVTLDPRIRDSMEKNYNQIQDGRFPEPTLIQNNEESNNIEIDIYKYTLNPKRKSHWLKTKVYLEFIDISGEFYESLNLGEGLIKFFDQTNNLLQINDIVGYLNSCHGILFFLDPTKRSDNNHSYYQRLLSNLFGQLKGKNEDSECIQYIAFCVTKIDEKEYWEKAQKPAINLVKDVMGESLFETIKNYFYFNQNHVSGTSENRCNFYGISSIGRYKNPNGSWDEAIEKINNSNNPEMNISENEDKSPVLGKFISSSQADRVSDNQSDDDDDFARAFGDNNQSQKTQLESNRLDKKIKTGETLVPINIVAPIKWLIKSIQSNKSFSSN